MLAEGVDPAALLDGCMEAMRRVGSLFEKKEYFISALIMAVKYSVASLKSSNRTFPKRNARRHMAGFCWER